MVDGYATTLAGRLATVSVIGISMPAAVLAQTPLAAATDAVGEIVVVTARKIEEDLQDVPMSVQALSRDFLDEANLTRLYELQFSTPGLVVTNVGLFGSAFSLRGIANQAGTGTSVAPHLNGVYLGHASLAIARMFDLERTEVLKGPQGTLYGRNATGGSINFITRSPQSEFGAAVEATYGSFATARLEGHVNVPLRNAAVRVAYIASEGDGYIRNSVDDRRFAEDDFRGLRVSSRVELSDAVRLEIMAQHVKDEGASGELWTPRPDNLVDPTDIRLTTVTLDDPYLVTENSHISVNLDYDFAFATLRSITGYARNRTRDLDDCAGVPILQDCVRGGVIDYSQWSQEIQLLLYGAGPLDGLVGLHYFASDDASSFHQLLPRVNVLPLNANENTTRQTATAVFGQATVRLGEHWSATGGLRLSGERHRETTIGTGLQDSPTLLVGKHESDDTSWRFDVRYARTDDLLLYASVSTGYKSGGLVMQPLFNGQPDPFDREDVIAYELGVKSQWLTRRLTLNAAAFHYVFDDMQVFSIAVIGNQLLSEVSNAAKAEVHGIDAEGMFRVSDRLGLSAGAIWMPKRKFVRFRNEYSGETLSGNKLARVPERMATAAISYEHPLRDAGNLSGRVEYGYRSSHFFTQDNNPLFAQGSFGLLNALVRFESASRKWNVFAWGRNLTDQDYFNQVFLQSSPGYPVTYEIGAGYRF
jgi:iron complex outermembrane recepter protein